MNFTFPTRMIKLNEPCSGCPLPRFPIRKLIRQDQYPDQEHDWDLDQAVSGNILDKQGRIHGYPSRVLVGRSSGGEGQ